MDLSSLALTISLGYSQYTDEKGPTPEPHFRVAVAKDNYYLWGQYEDVTPRILGQGIGDSSVTSFGIGARKNSGDFFVFGELGYGIVDEGAKDTIQQEIVYTELLRNHRVDFRPPPVYPQNDYDQDSYETLWELDDGLMGEVGVGWQEDSLSLTLSYRAFYVDEHIELWDEEQRANGGGWWQETRSRDLSAVQLRVGWEF